MKKIVSLFAALVLCCTAVMAMAETVIQPDEKRNIKLQAVTTNEMQDGISPITGRTLADIPQLEGFAGQAVTGRYMPMLVQIDNADGGANQRAAWGVSYADIIYEMPLYKNGQTRLTFLFSDLIPDSVGPVRSARMAHVWLREEYDAGFLYYGQQEYEKTNAKEEISRLGVGNKGLAFSGLVSGGKPWKQYYTRRSGLPAPHNVDANVSAMYDLIDPSFVPRNHTFLFADAPAQGEAATQVCVDTGHEDYFSTMEYDESTGKYYRYVGKGKNQVPYVDKDTGEHIGFENVIIQFAQVDWYASDAPVAFVVGEKNFNGKGTYDVQGNADFFMNGVHVKGAWQRQDMESRTVFYTEDGQELKLQPGHTLIVVVDSEHWQVSYQ